MKRMESLSSMFGVLDVLVIGSIAGLAFYWFKLRKKPEPAPIKNLVIGPALNRSSSYDPSFINKMKHGNKNIVVFFGSQTGTAEEFAGRLAKDANRYGLKALVADPEECDMEELSQLTEIPNSVAIFCLATYGEGDPTDNAQEFFNLLNDGGLDVNGVNFTVFGLGNKTYEHYNAMGKLVDKKLEEAGGERIHPLGLGDDDANIEEDFVTWREGLWPAICEKFGITSVGEDVSFRQYSLTVHDETTEMRQFTGEPARFGSLKNQKPPYDAKNPFCSPVQANKELHKGGGRSCMHIEFNISGSKIRYDTGDHVAVFPINSTELVEHLGERLKVDLGQLFTLTNVDEDASKKHPFPCPTTYRNALLHYLDITSYVKTNILKEMIEYAADNKDKDFLQSLIATTHEGKELYNEWIVASHRTIVHVLDDLPSVEMPIDHLCELLPRLHPRYYSIASSPKMHPESIHITALLIDWTTKSNRQQLGVATSYLRLKQPCEDSNLHPTVPVYVRKSQFRLPFKSTTPVLMVGPGTGLAPFRGFIQDRHQLKLDGKPIGAMYLYFGCRNRGHDFIYEDEIESYKSSGTLTEVRVAFSRDQDKKVYVQNLLREDAEKVWKYLDTDGAHIYVCGDARHMAPDVDKALKEIAMEQGGLAEQAAVDYLKKLRTRGRYSCDVWS